jgi:hypothetical protein
VRAVVAHEPPITALPPEAPDIRVITDSIVETCRTEGWGRAMGGSWS